MNKGRAATMQKNVTQAEREAIMAQRVAPFLAACADITQVKGVDIRDFATAVVKQFKGTGVDQTMLVRQFATVAKQEAVPR